MEFKTKSGKKVKFKDVSIDQRDELLDTLEYSYKENGDFKNIKMINTTMTKWMRIGLEGDITDDFLRTLSMQDRTEIFISMQEHLMLGEENASK